MIYIISKISIVNDSSIWSYLIRYLEIQFPLLIDFTGHLKFLSYTLKPSSGFKSHALVSFVLILRAAR